MTDEQIIKALECCKNSLSEKDACGDCPLYEEEEVTCITILSKNAFDLIKRQKAEIEELIEKLECLLCHSTDGRLSKHTYSLKTMELEVTDTMNRNYNDGYDEAIKEFAEMIIMEYPEVDYFVSNLAKEMTEQ